MPSCECRQRLSATHGKLCGAVDRLLVTWLVIFAGEVSGDDDFLGAVLAPKWMVYNRKSAKKWMIWGYPHGLETPIHPSNWSTIGSTSGSQSCWIGYGFQPLLNGWDVEWVWEETEQQQNRQQDFKHYADLPTTVEPHHVEILVHLPFIRICSESPRLLQETIFNHQSNTQSVHNSFGMYCLNIPDIPTKKPCFKPKAQLLTHPIFW